MHAADLVLELNDPTGQLVQLMKPSAELLKVPAGHAAQIVEPAVLAKVPGEQTVQEDRAEAP